MTTSPSTGLGGTTTLEAVPTRSGSPQYSVFASSTGLSPGAQLQTIALSVQAILPTSAALYFSFTFPNNVIISRPSVASYAWYTAASPITSLTALDIDQAPWTLNPNTVLFAPYAGMPTTIISVNNVAVASLDAITVKSISSEVKSNSISLFSTSTTYNAAPTSSGPASTSIEVVPGSSSSVPALVNGTTSTASSSTSIAPVAAGSAIGGLVFGIILGGLLVFCCLSTRLSKRYDNITVSTNVIPRKAIPSTSVREKETQSAESVTDLSWRKHLTQEADDSTIKQELGKLFHFIQSHIEGYYATRSESTPEHIVATIEILSPDGLAEHFRHSSNVSQLLEALVARVAVHRISCYSGISDSLLPSEYTQIPRRNGWHMESEHREACIAAESKGGFLPALNQWRVLTGFLGCNIEADAGFQKSLDSKVNRAIVELEKAMAFWVVPGSDSTNRRQNLRSLLMHASRTGIILFQQPSIFMFDWSGAGKHTIVVYPALRRRLDEQGRVLIQRRALIESSQTSIL